MNNEEEFKTRLDPKSCKNCNGSGYQAQKPGIDPRPYGWCYCPYGQQRKKEYWKAHGHGLFKDEGP